MDSPEFGQPAEQPQRDEAANRARLQSEFERTNYYDRGEFESFPEKLSPKEVVFLASELRNFWLVQWQRLGEAPYDFNVLRARQAAAARVVQLSEGIVHGLYKPKEDEKLAGLIEGTHHIPLAADSFKEGDQVVDKQGHKVLIRDGHELGRIAVNTLELDVLQQLGVDTSQLKGTVSLALEVETPADKAVKNRELLTTTIDTQQKVIEAWSSILTKVHEQDVYSLDQDAYVDKAFTGLGKRIVRGRMYAEVFNNPPTMEGMEKFGNKTITALEAWREIVEGRAFAKIGFKDPTPEDPNNVIYVEGRIPNPFAYAKNQRLIEICLEYVQRRVSQENPPVAEVAGDELKRSDARDNYHAAIAGLVFVDHFDIDADAAKDVATVYQNGRPATDMVFEIAYTDSAKMLNPRDRRMKERLGLTPANLSGEKRDHGYAAGSGVSLRFLPDLGSHFLEEVTVGTLAVNRAGETKVIKVTLDQIAYGAKDGNGKRIVSERDDGKWSKVRQAKFADDVDENKEVWYYKTRPLSDRSLWDEASIVIRRGDGAKQFTFEELASFELVDPQTASRFPEAQKKPFELVEGTNSLPYEVPKGLLERYALVKIFNQYNRIDYEQMLADYSNPSYLRDLNKGISLGLKLLVAQNQLSKDTQRDLEEFVRIALLANVVAAIVKNGEAKSGTGDEQIPDASSAIRMSWNDAMFKIKIAAIESQFVLTASDKKGQRKFLRTKDENLLENIVNRRDVAPLTPFDFNYFDEAQKKELEPLYR